MEYTVYHLIWIFLVYSFAGWGIVTASAAMRQHKFIDVGFLYGPWCPSFGVGGVAFAVFLQDLKEELFFLFLGGIILSFLVSLATGAMLERIFHRKWWDYSRKRFQFGGYVNLPYIIVWGAAAVVCVSFVNPALVQFADMIPIPLKKGILLLILGIMVLDFIATVLGFCAIYARIRKIVLLDAVSENLQTVADQMGEGLVGWVLKHLGKSNQELEAKKLLETRQERARQQEKEKEGVFAVGCSFYKLVLIFFIGAFLGDITETIYCLILSGELMSRSSVVYGPFSIVWGLGCMFLTLILYQYRNRSDSFIFLFGTFLGGAYEYICSVFTEIFFGTVFWDYSDIPFNLGGRINLLYCFFWGIAAVIWMRFLYPRVSNLIEKIPKKPGVIITWILLVFMTVNVLISALALVRYSQRQSGAQPESGGIMKIMDEHFDDQRMEKIYPNIKIVE